MVLPDDRPGPGDRGSARECVGNDPVPGIAGPAASGRQRCYPQSPRIVNRERLRRQGRFILLLGLTGLRVSPSPRSQRRPRPASRRSAVPITRDTPIAPEVPYTPWGGLLRVEATNLDPPRRTNPRSAPNEPEIRAERTRDPRRTNPRSAPNEPETRAERTRDHRGIAWRNEPGRSFQTRERVPDEPKDDTGGELYPPLKRPVATRRTWERRVTGQTALAPTTHRGSYQVDRGRCQEVLEMGLRLSDITTPPQPAPANV